MSAASNELVSLVVPAFNAARFVRETIDSILAQTYHPIELIVIDDGSSDGTADILAAYGGAVHQERQENRGQSATLTRGWNLASGALLGYVSADDRLRPDAVERVAAALAARPDAVLAYPDFGLIDAESRAIGTVRVPDYDVTLLVGRCQCLPGPGALFRRAAWQRMGPWDEGLRQVPDLDFYLRLCLAGPFLRVPETLADYRIHAGAITYSPVARGRADEPIRMMERFFARSDLPPDLARLGGSAHAHALMLSGLMHGRARRPAAAAARFLRAFCRHPSVLVSRTMASYLIDIAKPYCNAGRARP